MRHDFLATLQEKAPSFSKGQRRIAAYITESYDKAAFMTANRLGKVVGVSESTVVRFATELFRKLYQTLLYANIESSYEMTEEEEAALLAPDSGAWQMTLTVTDEKKTNTYSFYYLTPLKSYITINGNGGFYVMTNRVNKFTADAQRFFANQPIDATAKK